eukprot:TRINITY_DN32168_c0_g1_i1.p1 TRINITY_DN32168_c0_g1~~TRINITY_DN32168_c0_g1_i1.p1  ORF type:complete len:940 (+),score=315.68 TRINITY_DN32168_c0_g1_i1:61-2880(+)
MAAFTPNEGHYKQVVELLQQASNPQPAVQAAVWQSFNEYSTRVDFNCYLAHIMADRTMEAGLRQWAGLVLSKGIKNNYEDGVKANVSWIQGRVMETLGEENAQIRNAVANCVSHLASQGGLLRTLLEGLYGAMDSPDEHTASGACKAVCNICEDHLEALAGGKAEGAAQVLQVLLKHTASANPSTREQCLTAALTLYRGCNELQLLHNCEVPEAMTARVPDFLKATMRFAGEAGSTQGVVCSALVFVGDFYFAELRPYLVDTLAYLVTVQKQCTGVQDEVAREACDFWPIMLEQIEDRRDDAELRALFEGHLPTLLPLLVTGMRYSDLQLSMIHQASDDVSQPDRAEDILPRWRMKGKKKAAGHADPNASPADAEDADDEASSDDDDDDWDGDDLLWSLRKSSASTLDCLALTFGAIPELNSGAMLNVLVPDIARRLAPGGDWRDREAAIMALGAICEGLPNELAPHAGKLIEGLMASADPAAPPPTKDANFLIRSITSWTLQRFHTAFDGKVDQGMRDAMYSCLVQQLGDRSKKVVGATASALRAVLNKTEELSEAHAEQLLRGLNAAFAACQTINLNLLLNVCVALGEDHGEHLSRPDLAQLVMAPLTARWQGMPDEDVRLQAVMSCMAALAPAMGHGFQPFVKECFDRSVRILHARAEARRQSQYEPNGDEDYIVYCLDLLGGVLDAVESSVEPLIAATPVFAELLLACLHDPNVSVRSSAYALLGDVAHFAWPHLAPHAEPLAAVLRGALEITTPAVCINAAYALGEVVVNIGPSVREMPPGGGAFPEEVAAKLIRLVTAKPSGQNAQLLGENAAVALGRLALACPDVVAPRMDTFIKPWCLHAKRLTNEREQEQAFMGLSRLIRLNPSGCYAAFAYVCDAACSLEGDALTDALRKEYVALLNGFKSHIGAGWPQYFSQFSAKLREKLARLYGLA